MMKKLSKESMFSLILATIILIVILFLPWWRMEFYAPQYPEGLDIIVYPSTLDGDIDIVNGLNHYIGMKLFSNETFPELQYIPYFVIALAILTLVVAFIRKKIYLYVLIAIFIIGGIAGIVDMHFWLKTFGTELDPMAPIELEPFIPPIIGENTIANFVTYSKFSFGGYLLIVVFLLYIYPLWKDRDK